MTMGLAIFPTRTATWSWRIAAFSAQLLLAGLLLHRFAGLDTLLALNLFAVAMAGAVLAVLVALAAFLIIWRKGRTGAWSAAAGMLLGSALLLWPAALLPLASRLPPIHDISTDTADPPPFTTLTAQRRPGANPIAYPGPAVASLQANGYPDIKPIVVPRPAGETFELVGDIVRRFKWKVASEQPPLGRGRPGFIEATDRTFVLGFLDDIIVRIDGDGRETRIDARSASRYGRHDLGRNADRIRDLFQEIRRQLDTGTFTPSPRRRRERPGVAVPRRQKDAPHATAARSREPNPPRSDARRAPQPRERPRSQDERRARDKQ